MCSLSGPAPLSAYSSLSTFRCPDACESWTMAMSVDRPSMDPDLDGGGLNQEEEEKFINDNLIYIETFLGKLKNGEENLPATSRERVNTFRKEWEGFFLSSSGARNRPSVELPRAATAVLVSTGAIPKRRVHENLGPASTSHRAQEVDSSTSSDSSEDTNESIVPPPWSAGRRRESLTRKKSRRW